MKFESLLEGSKITVKILTFALCAIFFSFKLHAVDIVKIKHQQLSKKKSNHNVAVVKRALEITESEFGPFQLEAVNIKMTSDREIKVVKEGEILNATITPANSFYDQTLTPIKVPIRLGLLSYRLLLINKSDLPIFEKISTLEELKKVNAGLLHGWKTVGIYQFNDVDYIETQSYEGMFLMLNKHRFDYIPRASYEIYDELESQQAILNDIVVEPTIALRIPTLTYVYVSPKFPKLAKRLTTGLKKMSENGDLKALIYKFYESELKKANIPQRKVIKLESDYYNRHVNVKDEQLLYGL